MTMWTRFGIASRQSPKHEYQDRAGRVGGELVTDDGTPMRRLSARERKDAEADGELYVAPTGPHGHLYFVADGIGSAPFGGRTAELVSQRLPELVSAPATWEGLTSIAQAINAEAWSWGHDDTGKSKAGCAATLVWFAGNGSATVGGVVHPKHHHPDSTPRNHPASPRPRTFQGSNDQRGGERAPQTPSGQA